MDSLKRTFLRGLFTLLPIAVTIYVLYMGILIFENILGSFLKVFIPQTAYVPGLGFLLSIVLIFLFGLILNSFLAASILGSIERRLTAVPFIRAVYSPLKDLMNLFSSSSAHSGMGVVFVEISPGFKIIGLVTRDHFDDLPTIQQHLEGKIVVYIPQSYGLGGFSTFVDKSKVSKADLAAEKALSLAITGWIKSPTEEDPFLKKM